MFAWLHRDTIQKRKFKIAREAKARRLQRKEEKRLQSKLVESWDVSNG